MVRIDPGVKTILVKDMAARLDNRKLVLNAIDPDWSNNAYGYTVRSDDNLGRLCDREMKDDPRVGKRTTQNAQVVMADITKQ